MAKRNISIMKLTTCDNIERLHIFTRVQQLSALIVKQKPKCMKIFNSLTYCTSRIFLNIQTNFEPQHYIRQGTSQRCAGTRFWSSDRIVCATHMIRKIRQDYGQELVPGLFNQRKGMISFYTCNESKILCNKTIQSRRKFGQLDLMF